MYSYKLKRRSIFYHNKTELRCLLYLLPAGLGYLLVLFSRVNPHLTERFYSNGIFPVVRIITSPFGRLPFSLAEVLLFTCVITGLLFLVYIPYHLLHSQHRKEFLVRSVKTIIFTASSVYFLFTLTCAPNYNRLTFAELSGLTVEKTEISALAEVCDSLLTMANHLGHQPLPQNASFAALATASWQAFDSLEGYSFIPRAISPPKPMIFSEVLSQLQLTGFYFPYTGEATVNADMPTIEMPFTMLHELAHTAGFMREDEANFIAYLVGSSADDSFVRYSATVCALNHCMNALYRHNQEDYFLLRAQYSDRLSQDIQAQSRYWAQYDTPVAELSERVNSAYLRANSQADGTHSYGRMVDLMIAYAKAQKTT